MRQIDTLFKYVNGEIQPVNQEEEGITYAEKIQKVECRISWEKSADEILSLIRGLSPYPGAWFLSKKNKNSSDNTIDMVRLREL